MAFNYARPALLRDLHIRIRAAKRAGAWQWELVTGDGHVANTSESFDSRAECEADAKLQNLPVVGLTRPKTTKRQHQNEPTLVISSDKSALWRWKHIGEQVNPC